MDNLTYLASWLIKSICSICRTIGTYNCIKQACAVCSFTLPVVPYIPVIIICDRVSIRISHNSRFSRKVIRSKSSISGSVSYDSLGCSCNSTHCVIGIYCCRHVCICYAIKPSLTVWDRKVVIRINYCWV